MFTTADQIYLNIFIIIQFEALLIIYKMLLVLTTQIIKGDFMYPA